MDKKLIIILEIFLLGLVVSDDLKNKKIAIVDQEEVFVNKTYQDCEHTQECVFLRLNCKYLDEIKDFEKEYYHTPEEAQEAVRNGKAWGVLYFTDNFTDALVARIILQEDADEETIDQSKARVWLTAADEISLRTYLEEVFKKVTKNILDVCNFAPRDVGSLFLYQDPIEPKTTKIGSNNKEQNKIENELDWPKIAIFNNEQTYVNKTFQECPWENFCKLSNLSCRFLDAIDNAIKEYYPSIEAAKNAVRDDGAWGAMYITENFTDAWVARVALEENADDETLDQSVFKVWTLTSGNKSTRINRAKLTKKFKNATQKLLSDCDRTLEDMSVSVIPLSFQNL